MWALIWNTLSLFFKALFFNKICIFKQCFVIFFSYLRVDALQILRFINADEYRKCCFIYTTLVISCLHKPMYFRFGWLQTPKARILHFGCLKTIKPNGCLYKFLREADGMNKWCRYCFILLSYFQVAFIQMTFGY